MSLWGRAGQKWPEREQGKELDLVFFFFLLWLGVGSGRLVWFESPSCTKEGALLSACLDVGIRDRRTDCLYKLSAIKISSGIRLLIVFINPLPQHEFPRIHPLDEAKLFFPLGSKQTTWEPTVQAEVPLMTGDNALSRNRQFY